MLEPAGHQLRDRLVRLFETGARLDDATFDALAREVFAFQLDHNRPYAEYCRRRGVDAKSVEHWTRIPAAPVAAFREVALVAGDPARCDAVFRTSGTTRGRDRRGEHYIPDLSVYHASLVAGFSAHVLADGAQPAMLSIVPPPRDLPDSSLAHMINVVMKTFDASGGAWFASTRRGVHTAELNEALDRFTRAAQPVCLLGTSFSFVHWLDALAAEQRRFRLPDGSRLMDTGGYKGKSRAIPETELRAAYTDRLGLDPRLCMNEYGMTELCSQYYDSTLDDGYETAGRVKRGPAWLRAVVVDPETLDPLPVGRAGLLRHVDLANIGSVVAVQTEDLGAQVDEGGFVLLGRVAGATPRGCSIALDDLIRAAASGTAGSHA